MSWLTRLFRRRAAQPVSSLPASVERVMDEAQIVRSLEGYALNVPYKLAQREPTLAELRGSQPHLNETQLVELKKARSRSRRPDTTIARDLPITSDGSSFQQVQDVKDGLQLLENGQFQVPATLADVMTRDDRINGVLGTRVNALLGLARKTTDAPGGEKVSEALTDQLWAKMFPEDQLSLLKRWADLVGVGIGELIWERSADEWIPHLKVWHPRYLYWRWDTYSFWLMTADEGAIEINPGDGKWVLYTPGGRFQRGWMTAAIRSLAIPWLTRQWAYRDWARYSEVHGIPTRVGEVPVNAKKEDKDRFFRELLSLGNEPAILLPKGDSDAASFGFRLEEATAQTWDGFQALITKTEDSIAIAVLGQSLTTQVNGALGMGTGAADVQQRVKGDYLRADATTLGACLSEQVLRPWASYNFGDPDLAPQVTWNTDPPEDKKAVADTAVSVSTAIKQFRDAGVNVDVKVLCEKTGIPLVEGEEPLAPLPQATAPGEEPPSPVEEQAKAVVALTSALVEGQLAADDTTDLGAGGGVEVLRHDLENVLADIHAATSYEDLRQRLLARYESMNPVHLQQLVAKAVLVADLNGQFRMNEDL